MEKQSYTAKELIKKNLNYIIIVIICIINVIISLFSITDGVLGLKTLPTTIWGWILWLIGILISPTMGIFIMAVFRNQGIREGHNNENVKPVYNEYIQLIHKRKDTIPRSEKQWQKQKIDRAVIKKYITSIILSVFMVNILISINLNSLLTVIVNTILWLAWGLFQMIEAEKFVTEELVVWYKLEIEKINNPSIPEKTIKKISATEFDNAMNNMLKYNWTEEFYEAINNIDNYVKGDKK